MSSEDSLANTRLVFIPEERVLHTCGEDTTPKDLVRDPGLASGGGAASGCSKVKWFRPRWIK